MFKKKIILYLVSSFFAMVLISLPVFAIDYNMQTKIPGMSDQIHIGNGGIAIGNYIVAIYKFSVNIMGVISAVAIMVGGIIWLTAGGSADRVTKAKSIINSALIALILTLTSYSILNFINPDLVKMYKLNIETVKTVDMPKDDEKREITENSLICCALTNICEQTTVKSCKEKSGTPHLDSICKNGVCQKEECAELAVGSDCHTDTGTLGYCEALTCYKKKLDGKNCRQGYECVNECVNGMCTSGYPGSFCNSANQCINTICDSGSTKICTNDHSCRCVNKNSKISCDKLGVIPTGKIPRDYCSMGACSSGYCVALNNQCKCTGN